MIAPATATLQRVLHGVRSQSRLLGLTLTRPWPWTILHCPTDPKRIENRGWTPPTVLIGQVIALHAGQGFEDAATIDWIAALAPELGEHHPTGIVGLARVTGWIWGRAGTLDDWRPRLGPAAVSIAAAEAAARSRWFFGPVGWLLEDVVALPEPIRCRGFQKLWGVDDAGRDAIRGQLERMAA